ncbi:hypothetical protein NLU13_6214 [Sarocladium strictum]|uniref:Translation initiation factor eIF2B subunit gamma n=1 Tax=Sarocladium strictum TaxID=5046 RepID=A0AA39GFG7_SARSR|nr:hypothetical protein NLU13_6214 [Sarocladium strictum]
MPHAVSMPSTGLQALILCGPGSSLPTFTSNPDENPKALLPIANRPMVWYPIDFCHRMGITDITLICPPSAYEAINTGMNTNPSLTALPLPRPDILAPKDLDYNTGTAHLLRLPEVTKLIRGDFVVLPCDLVCELGGHQLLQAWMVKGASLTQMLQASAFTNGKQSSYSGGLGVWYDTKSSVPLKGEETDFVATAPLQQSPGLEPRDSLLPNLSKLVLSMPTDSLNDTMEDKGSMSIRHGLIRAHPRVRMRTQHRDAHIYIFPRWILDFIRNNDRLETLGEDVIGWWAKAGWQKGLVEKMGVEAACAQKHESEEAGLSPTEYLSPRESSPESRPDSKSSSGSDKEVTMGKLVADMKHDESKTFEVPPIIAYTHASTGPGSLIRRADTAPLLLTLSLQLAKLPSLEEVVPEEASPFAHPRKIAYPEGVKSRTTITKADCLIAENVTVEEKTSIKECVIGANSQIGEGAKLAQCLLMDGVVVGKGCKLTRCILGKRCIIGDGSTLTDCEIQENLLVEPQTEDKDNKLMSSEGLEATEAEMDEVLQEIAEETALQEEAQTALQEKALDA